MVCATTSLAYPKDYVFFSRSAYGAYIIWCHPSRIFYILFYVLWLVTMSSNVTDVWQCDIVTLTLTLSSRIEK